MSGQSDEDDLAKNFVEIPAHKVVLAARCPYFMSHFCRSWSDTNASIVTFSDFQEHSMREFLSYLYTGRLKIDISTIMGVLKIASFMGLE